MPPSRYGRRDLLQVVGIPHSVAILVSSWASSVWVVLRVSAACVNLLSKCIAPNVASGVCWLCVFEINCMKKWCAEQESSGIFEGLIAELVEAYVSEKRMIEHCQSCVLGVLSVIKRERLWSEL